MGQVTKISWTDHTLNCWIGCSRVSEGCRNCYAEEMVVRRWGQNLWGPAKTTERKRTKTPWQNARKWSRQAQKVPGILGPGRPRMVFLGSLMDVFEDHPDANAIRPEMWQLIRECENLDFQLLTKRPENIKRMLPDDWGHGYQNAWLGASVEDEAVEDRIAILCQVPALLRFISYEPAIGPLAHSSVLEENRHRLHWMIYGGESGPNFREHDIQWARDMKVFCQAHAIAFFYKQAAARFPGHGIELDGFRFEEFPVSWIRRL